MAVYGEIYVDAGVTTQVTDVTPGTFNTVDGFNTAQGFNGASASNVTPDKANNQLTLTLAGTYAVSFHCSFSGTANASYTCAAFLDGVQVASCAFVRKLGIGGDVGNASFDGFVTATAGQVLTVGVAGDSTSNDFLPQYMNLSVELMA